MSERQEQPEPKDLVRSTTTELAKLYQITEKQAEFLAAYLQTGNISEAARQTGQCRDNHYQTLSYSEGYIQAYKTVRTLLGSKVIEKMLERAIDGDPTLYKGKIVRDAEGQPIKSFDTVNQIFLAKSLGKLTDQPDPGRTKTSAGPTVNIYLPEQQSKPVIEVENEAEE